MTTFILIHSSSCKQFFNLSWKHKFKNDEKEHENLKELQSTGWEEKFKEISTNDALKVNWIV